jgi:hypothetical protein
VSGDDATPSPVIPLVDEPFTLTDSEDEERIKLRFGVWLDAVIDTGLARWEEAL